MLAIPQTQSLQFLGGFRVGGAGVVALLVVVVLDEGAGVVVEVVDASSGIVELLLKVARVAFSESELPGRCGSRERTHWMKVFWDCFSSGLASDWVDP